MDDLAARVEILYWLESMSQIAARDLASAVGLFLTGFIVVLSITYRSYRSTVPAAAYPPEMLSLSIDFLIAAVVAVGTAAAVKVGTVRPGEVSPLNRWALVLAGFAVVGCVLYFLSIDWLLRNERRRRQHLIATVLGWSLVEFRRKDELRRYFLQLSERSSWLEDSNQFSEALEAGLRKFEDRHKRLGLSANPPEAALAQHVSAERRLCFGWTDWLVAIFQMLPAYLLVCAALYVIREALSGRV